MTNPTAPATPSAPAADAPPVTPASVTAPAGEVVDTPSTATTEEPSDVSEGGGNREAAAYRVKLREAESQRDALAGQVADLRRRECEAVAGQLLAVPGDMWEIGQLDPVAFYAEDGALNVAELQAAVGALVDQRPRLGKGPVTHNWGQSSAPMPVTQTGWDRVINPG